MSKVIIFSRSYPVYHPKKGEQTFFAEKFLRSIYGKNPKEDYTFILTTFNQDAREKPKKYLMEFFFSLDWRPVHNPKGHTIRAGQRFKKGDYFSPRVWSGLPYRSKQICIAPDTEIAEVYDFEIIDGLFWLGDGLMDPDVIISLAKNDGLLLSDFKYWFKYPKPFKGQIIVWDKNIKY